MQKAARSFLFLAGTADGWGFLPATVRPEDVTSTHFMRSNDVLGSRVAAVFASGASQFDLVQVAPIATSLDVAL